MIEIWSNNACCCSQDARLFVSSICCSTKNENLSLEVVLYHFPWEPTEIDGMLPSLAPLLVECAGKREPLCEVAGMPKAKDPLELRKVQCGWCALSVSTWFDLTFASEHHAQQIDSMIPVWSTCDRIMAAHVSKQISVGLWTDMDRYFQLQPLFWPKFLPTKQKSQMIILRLAVLVRHATSICSSAEVYSYSQPHVLSRLNVLRALKESMSQMPVPCQNPRGMEMRCEEISCWNVEVFHVG